MTANLSAAQADPPVRSSTQTAPDACARGKVEGMEKVVILTQYSLPDNKRNMNAYQRVFHGARYARITLMVRRTAEVSEELKSLVQVHRAPVDNRWLFVVYATLAVLVLRLGGARFVLTDPSGFAVVGFAARFLAGYTWALDVWDRPRWRTGQHEEDKKARFSDRLVFWMMKHAQIYLLSVLPRAAKDIDPEPSRCVQLYNAFDQALVAETPLTRSTKGDQTLHLAYGRSQFWDTMGLNVVIEAAELLKAKGCPILIHLIGELPDSERERINRSRAASCFKIHGFTKATRIEFFRTIQVGLVPYLGYEDLKYIFPIKVLEHLSQGNPVIATNLPGLCSMVKHEGNGLVVEPGDSTQLAGAIERLQSDHELFNRLSENALKSIRRFDVEAKNEEIFGRILNWKGN